jgi:hypothetical protein
VTGWRRLGTSAQAASERRFGSRYVGHTVRLSSGRWAARFDGIPCGAHDTEDEARAAVEHAAEEAGAL